MALTELSDGTHQRDPLPGQGGATQQTAPTPPDPNAARRAGIASVYKSALGRDPSESDYMSWVGNENFKTGIENSPEAKAHAQGQTYTRQYNPMAGWDPNKLNDPNKHDPKYDWGRAVQEWGSPVGGQLDGLVSYYNKKHNANARVTGFDTVDFGDGLGSIDVIQGSHSASPTAWWNPTGGGRGGGGGATGGSGGVGGGSGGGAGLGAGSGSYGAGGQPYNPYAPGGAPGTTGAGLVSGNPGVFSDPATTEWEGLLRKLVDTMNTGRPTMTDAQREIRNTQVLDPMTQERDALKQRATERLATRGITPGSGIFDDAMREIDRQYEMNRTKTQAGFATEDVNREDQTYKDNLSNAVQAVGFMKQVPQLADSRLLLAHQIQDDPSKLTAQLLQQSQLDQRDAQYQQNQQQAYYQNLINTILGMFGNGDGA